MSKVIVYGHNKVEQELYSTRSALFNSEEIIRVDSIVSLTDALRIIKYRPFFNDKWFVVVEMDKLEGDSILEAIKLLKHPRVQPYLRIAMNGTLYSTLLKAKAIREMEDLTILNAKFPSREYIVDIVMRELTGFILENNALTYISNEVRFDISKLPDVIGDIRESGLRELSLKDMKKILPQSTTKDLKAYVYAMLLSNLPELKEHWKDLDKQILSANAGTVKKPYTILDSIEWEPKYILKRVNSILSRMKYVKGLVMQGKLSAINVFDKKDTLSKFYPKLKTMTIPEIREYIQVSSEVTSNELDYFIYEFGKLQAKQEINIYDLIFTTKKMMTRHEGWS